MTEPEYNAHALSIEIADMEFELAEHESAAKNIKLLQEGIREAKARLRVLDADLDRERLENEHLMK